jgi:hypothetical protein
MSIPVMIALNPYANADPNTTGDQRLHRGGLVKVGDADPAAGGGSVYVAVCSGGLFTVDPTTNIASLVAPAPTVYGPRNYLRFVSGGVICQATFDWLTLSGISEPGVKFLCDRTDL